MNFAVTKLRNLETPESSAEDSRRGISCNTSKGRVCSVTEISCYWSASSQELVARAIRELLYKPRNYFPLREEDARQVVGISSKMSSWYCPLLKKEGTNYKCLIS